MIERVEAWKCARCGKPVSRVLGLGGGVVLDGGDALTVRTVARGYCREHREDVGLEWAVELESLGEVEWTWDPPVELRPQDVARFLSEADAVFGLRDLGNVTDSGESSCPHCNGPVKFGAGPHREDAAWGPGAVGWVCSSCGSAGYAYGVS